MKRYLKIGLSVLGILCLAAVAYAGGSMCSGSADGANATSSMPHCEGMKAEHAGSDQCTLYFLEGQVSHATYGKAVGDEAVFKVLRWTEGDWELDFTKTTSQHTTTMSTQGLMMEGLRLLDEANRDAG